MAGYFETDIFEEGTAINRAEIDGAVRRQGIGSIDKGDVVSEWGHRMLRRSAGLAVGIAARDASVCGAALAR